MKIHNVRVYRDDRDWSTFAILEFDCQVQGKKGFEMYPLLVSDFFTRRNKKVIGYFFDSYDELMRRVWANDGFKYESISIEETNGVGDERIESMLIGTMKKKDLLAVFGINDNVLTDVIQRYPAIRIDEDSCNRWELEKFLYKSKLLTKKHAALKLGIKISDFDEVISLLRTDYPILNYSLPMDCSFVPSNFDDLVRYTCFPSLNFESDEAFKHQFHILLQSRRMRLVPEYCFITRALKIPIENKFFASYVDLVLHQSVNRVFSIPIRNDKKPGFLPPDRISFYTYLMYQEKFEKINMYFANQEELNIFKGFIQSV